MRYLTCPCANYLIPLPFISDVCPFYALKFNITTEVSLKLNIESCDLVYTSNTLNFVVKYSIFLMHILILLNLLQTLDTLYFKHFFKTPETLHKLMIIMIFIRRISML